MPALGPVLGKGDAMWRALSVLEGELVCFLDADTEGFSAHFATRPARPAGVRAGRVVREGASTAARWREAPRRRRRARQPPDGAPGAGAVLPASSRACASRSRARWRRGASCSSGCRSRPATASRSRC